MTHNNTNANRLAATRLSLFQQREDIQRVTARYAHWSETSSGIMINVQLAGLAMLHMAGKLSSHAYRKRVSTMAKANGIPVDDFRIIARCMLELIKSMPAKNGAGLGHERSDR